jgi:ABC-type antimicrobial peptide transport system permease subunit
MILYNLRILLREIFRNKTISGINIFGLSFAFVGAILIWLWVWDELNYDRFYENANDIYLVVNKNIDDNGNSVEYVESPAPMSSYLEENFPEIKKSVRVDYFYRGGLIQNGGDTFKEKGAAVDPSFFDVFNIPITKGNKRELFSNKGSIVISENMATRYYGNLDPIGKVLNVKGYGNDYKSVIVTGVFKDFPKNSSINIDFVVPFLLEEKSYLEEWNVSIYATFVLLDKNANLPSTNEKMGAIYKNVIDDDHHSSYLFPFVGLHLNTQLSFFGNSGKGNIKLIYILILIAILILLIACINYISLAKAQSIKQANVISIKKILGINRRKLFLSFFIKALFFVLLSFHLAIILVELVRPVFNHLSQKQIAINYFDSHIIGYALVIISITSLIIGIYSYLFAIRKRIQLVERKKNRNLLVVFQFVISIVLIIYSMVIIKQVNYIYNKDLGFDKENIIMINSSDIDNNIGVVKNKILKNPDVISITNGSSPMRSGWPDSWSWNGKTSDNRLAVIRIDADRDYLKTLNINLSGGRFFSGESSENSKIVINKKFAEIIGDRDVLGRKINFRNKSYEVIGVVDNFYSNHFSEEIKPVAFFNNSAIWLLIKVKDSNSTKTLNSIKTVFKQVVPDRPFEFTALQEQFDSMYSSDVNMGKLFLYFSSLAILISCMGLFGISLIVMELKKKEIGIRKVLGASTRNIIVMLNKKFVVLVLISFVISCPIGFYISHNWLQDFVYRTELTWWIFVLAGSLILAIALLTVSWYSLIVARRNPVESLHYE